MPPGFFMQPSGAHCCIGSLLTLIVSKIRMTFLPDELEGRSILNAMSANTAPGAPVQIDSASARQAYLAGDFARALHIAQSLSEQHPLDIDCLLLEGACHMRLDDLASAERTWLGALEIDPRSALARTNLGVLYKHSFRFDEAMQCFRTALSHDPAYEVASLELIELLRQKRNLEEAEWFARRSVSLSPVSARAFDLLGLILQDVGKFDEAEAMLGHAMKLDPLDSTFALHLGYLLLSQGRWKEGLLLCERRHAHDLNSLYGNPPRVAFPQWKGESLRGKSLLIWPEQALGDQIQLARYIQRLRGRGAARITLVCDAALQPLFVSMHGVDAVLSPEVYYMIGAPVHDFWVFCFSIPLHVGDTPSTIPNAIPYLKAPKKRIAKWQAPLRVQGRKIGLAWRGSEANPRDVLRSLPSVALLDPLGRVEGASFVSLQRDTRETSVLPMLHVGDQLAHFGDLAAVIANLDLVITVDNAVAHLAAALGKPTWVLLPNVGRDWRWGHEGSDSVWYPGVMRLFRQAASEKDWSATIERVVQALGELS
jgi:Flp pilus assembly protein TadD